MSFITAWLTNPWMLGAGALAVASPVIIHLLNKRRFKIVTWAAMEFLLEANKKNRRRVQLENLIVLLLRCLAMLLLGLLLARPFLPSGLSELLQNTQRFERIVILDDSVSMLATESTGTPWQAAIEGLNSLVRQMADSRTDDSLTVILTSRPESPVMIAEDVSSETVDSVLLELEGLRPSDFPADYRGALRYVDQYLKNAAPGLNRMLYVFSDQRNKDWNDGSLGEDAEAPAGHLKKLSNETAGTYLIDLSVANEQNIAVVAVRQERQLVAGSVARFEVDLKNWGAQAVRDIQVEFRIGQGQPIIEKLPELNADETATVVFQHVFPTTVGNPLLGRLRSTGTENEGLTERTLYTSLTRQDDADPLSWMPGSKDAGKEFQDIPVEITLTAAQGKLDGLREDSLYHYVARVLDRIPVLLVDGDPSSLPVRSETYALLPLANPDTGIAADLVTATELETVPLSKYQVIFVCNVDRISYDRLASLEQWVRQGGSLILFPGNRVQAEAFNDVFYREGQGLSPVEITEIAGDPTRQSSVSMEPDPQPHPFLQRLVQIDAGIFSRTNVFSWWRGTINPKLEATTYSVPMRLTDEARSAAVVDRVFGQGRVVYLAMAADADWSDWPSSPSYIVVMFDMVREVVEGSLKVPLAAVGQDLIETIDLGRYRNQVRLEGPELQQWETVAQPGGTFTRAAKSNKKTDPNETTNDESDATSESADPPPAGTAIAVESSTPKSDTNTVFYEAMFARLPQRGIYKLKLKPSDTDQDHVRLVACNLEAREGELTLVDRTQLATWVGDKVELVSLETVGTQSVDVARDEFWFQVLIALLLTLGLEQFLACWFGTRRT
ncbi:MAG: BatA domain-containing protein [Planctomycetaceae bacterium]|nr:BatA domain-containing protein [Planctomycetaceae bacterium]